jgi:hypothetical protein
MAKILLEADRPRWPRSPKGTRGQQRDELRLAKRFGSLEAEDVGHPCPIESENPRDKRVSLVGITEPGLLGVMATVLGAETGHHGWSKRERFSRPWQLLL